MIPSDHVFGHVSGQCLCQILMRYLDEIREKHLQFIRRHDRSCLWLVVLLQMEARSPRFSGSRPAHVPHQAFPSHSLLARVTPLLSPHLHTVISFPLLWIKNTMDAQDPSDAEHSSATWTPANAAESGPVTSSPDIEHKAKRRREEKERTRVSRACDRCKK